ncbi:MAG: FadR/GntR family transcriptional regulator [Chloroflexota bacterium]
MADLTDMLATGRGRDGVGRRPQTGQGPPVQLRVERLYEQVVLAIARSIQIGEYPSGTTLPGEAELAQRFGVGRLVVREAIRILGSKGLVTVSQGKAARVEPPERWKIVDPLVVLMREHGATQRDVLDLRHLLEPGIAAAAAERATPEQLAVLEATHENLKYRDSMGPDRSLSTLKEIDFQFHMHLAAATGNSLLVTMLEPLRTLLLSARLAMNPYVQDTVERSRAAHQRILDAVRARAPEAARRAMEDHLREIAADVEQTERGMRLATSTTLTAWTDREST